MASKRLPSSNPTSLPSELPTWLAARFSSELAQARAEIEAEAARTGKQAGVVADRCTADVLAQAVPAGRAAPSPGTVTAYWRDYGLMVQEGRTHWEKATTFQHYNRLRSAYRYCEAQTISELRKAADRARRAGQFDDMRRLTAQAHARAVVFRLLFLCPDRPIWSGKAAALRAVGESQGRKSKRAAARRAPTPDQLAVALCNDRRGWARVLVAALCFAVFGVRPSELRKGARLLVKGEHVSLLVHGAKVDAVRGQARRVLTVEAAAGSGPAGAGRSVIALDVLRDAVTRGEDHVQLSDADLVAVRRAMTRVQPGLSPYAYRHARASDVKATRSRAEVAAWLGHASDRTQSGYGNARSASGSVTVRKVTATRPARAVKSLPGHRAKPNAAANLHSKVAGRRATAVPTVRSTVRGPRPR